MLASKAETTSGDISTSEPLPPGSVSGVDGCHRRALPLFLSSDHIGAACRLMQLFRDLSPDGRPAAYILFSGRLK
jgi:hypothetical protein